MTDYFALLQEPRRPWLEEEALKAKFLTLSATTHPDRFHNAPEAERREANRRYAELNSAYNCLRHPRDRLRHLLELELGHHPAEIQAVPGPVLELGFAVGRLCNQIDQFLHRRAQTTSPILKVQLFEQAQAWIDQIQALQHQISQRQEPLLQTLRNLNRAWELAQTDPDRRSQLPLDALEESYRLSSYLERWTSQLRQRTTELSL